VCLFLDEFELAVEDRDGLFERLAAFQLFTAMKHHELCFPAIGLVLNHGKSRLPAVIPINQEGGHAWIMADCIILPLSAHHPPTVNGQKLIEFPLVKAYIGLEAPVGVFVVRKADDSDHRRGLNPSFLR